MHCHSVMFLLFTYHAFYSTCLKTNHTFTNLPTTAVKGSGFTTLVVIVWDITNKCFLGYTFHQMVPDTYYYVKLMVSIWPFKTVIMTYLQLNVPCPPFYFDIFISLDFSMVKVILIMGHPCLERPLGVPQGQDSAHFFV